MRTAHWASLGAAFVMLFAACAPPLTTQSSTATSGASAPAPTVPAAAQGDALAGAESKYYAAAKTEPTLVLYGIGPTQLFTPVLDVFTRHFPGVKAEGVEQRGRETREKVLTEVKSRNVVASLALSGFTTQNELRAADVVEPYVSTQTQEMYPELVAPGGWASPLYLTINSIAINTNLVPPADEPKSWKDVLDPKWKGKLALDDPRGSGPGGNVLIGAELLFGQDFTRELAAQNLTFNTDSGPLWLGLVRGEYAMYLSAVDSQAVDNRRQGAPVKYLKPQEGIAPSPISMALIKGAPAPNAAKLFMEWAMSEEGQNTLAKQGFAPVRKGIKAAEPESDLEGVKLMPNQNSPDADKYLGDINARTKRWSDLFFP